VMEAYVHGVSTRKVDDLVKALGAASGISKSEVSRIDRAPSRGVADGVHPWGGPPA
jgi:transposase-like protein